MWPWAMNAVVVWRVHGSKAIQPASCRRYMRGQRGSTVLRLSLDLVLRIVHVAMRYRLSVDLMARACDGRVGLRAKLFNDSNVHVHGP